MVSDECADKFLNNKAVRLIGKTIIIAGRVEIYILKKLSINLIFPICEKIEKIIKKYVPEKIRF